MFNHFSFSDLHPLKGFCKVHVFVGNVHPSRQNLVSSPFSLLTYTYLKDFVKCMASSVTYIRQDGILLLSHFFVLLTYTYLKDFV